ncbi:probable cytochrome P450 6d2 [Eurosta solidaginis]|uniref:probable cytochrome P450 6d2 n=1 Tax=Eurosta solidaginis TaxID=178769 RepID=UPI0035311B33
MWLIVIAVVLVALTWLIHNQYSYWTRHGAPSDMPIPPFGSMKDTVLGKKALGFVIHDIYKRYQERFVGIFILFKPTLLIRDPELARNILVQDFNSFHDRGTDTNATKELLSLRGASWKTLRAMLNPLFSTGKIKGTLPVVNEVGDRLVNYIETQLKSDRNKLIDMKDVMTTYAIDIIGNVFFGLDVDSYKTPKNELRIISEAFITPLTWIDSAHLFGQFACTPLAKFIDLFGYVPTPFTLVRKLIKHTVDYREKNDVVRRDFLQLLIQLRNSGKINDDDNWYVETAAEEFKSMSIDMIADQCSLFYIAGSETTSVTSAFTLYELSMYPELLKTAVEEVDSVLARHNLKPGDPFTYEALQDMKFIELCIMETIRKYPGLPFINRECTKDYKIPDSYYTIKKGTAIMISTLGLHYDPEYFEDPIRYNPYRFAEERRNYKAEAYLPFGEGPRHCIAKRMGSVNSKIAIVKILASFNIEPNERKEIEFEFTSGVAIIAKGGLKMKLSMKAE